MYRSANMTNSSIWRLGMQCEWAEVGDSAHHRKWGATNSQTHIHHNRLFTFGEKSTDQMTRQKARTC